MLVSSNDARRFIRAAYGPEFKFRLTTNCTVGCRPVSDPRPTLCWRKLDKGNDSAVKIGRLLSWNAIDWSYEVVP